MEEDKKVNDEVVKCQKKLEDLRNKYASEDSNHREDKENAQNEIDKLGDELSDSMASKTKLEGELEESKTKTENCKNDMSVMNNIKDKLNSEIEEKTMDLHVALALLSIVSIVLIYCIYKLNVE